AACAFTRGSGRRAPDNHLKLWSQSASSRLATGPSLMLWPHCGFGNVAGCLINLVQNCVQRSGTSLQVNFSSAISSHAALGGQPRFGRVPHPGFKNKTLPRFSCRGTCVCPCKTTSTSFGKWSGGTCCRRNFNPPRPRSTTNGHS